MDVKIRGHYKQLKKEHVDRQMLERAHYHGKRLSSEKEPSKYLSFIVDGMDQGKTSLPHFAGRPSKIINHADLLKTHVSGIVNHGQGKFSTYVDFNQYPHDPNLTINLILKTLKKVAEEQGNRLPKIFYLQADNCFRENKNRFVLGFLELLVTEQIFKEVYMSFLPVGHTHEDVDAAFSKISEKLKVKDAETIPQLVNIIPDSEELDNMFNVKTWLEPCFNDISQISKPLHFKFYNYDGTTRTCYKGIHTEPWQTLDFNVLAYTPKGQPDKLEPKYDKINIERVKRQVSALQNYFTHSTSYNWWIEFLNSLEREPAMKRYKWILKDLPRQTEQAEHTEIIDVPRHIEEMLEKEREIPKVIVKAKKKQTQTGQKNRVTGKTMGKSKTAGTAGTKERHKKSGKRRVLTQSKTVIIPVIDDSKRHIWLWILICMIDIAISLLILIVMILLTSLCTILRMLKYLNSIWQVTINMHTGQLHACVHEMKGMRFFRPLTVQYIESY
ncbi:uncharacterized protein LOC123543812 [Mercenaria mercenaria]|uniref:uncharacterized protein LOC123543812 n=1 Tax=Mercenaria mercenaria TaxID=6596 RepID=UPI00234F55E5|nr:uncharacterized protein LOC123543812 [Mercenaria mercenaria]